MFRNNLKTLCLPNVPPSLKLNIPVSVHTMRVCVLCVHLNKGSLFLYTALP
jgi:hypothetical protein